MTSPQEFERLRRFYAAYLARAVDDLEFAAGQYASLPGYGVNDGVATRLTKSQRDGALYRN